MSVSEKTLPQFQTLVEIVAQLRGPQGCPWDKEQTHQSLTQYAIEEVFEMVEAIEKNDDYLLKEELGDNLFQVILHSQLAQERNAFDISEVIAVLNEKLVRRHPHVFSDTTVADTNDVIKNWELIKQSEKANSAQVTSTLNVPVHLPALQRAYKIGKRTEKLKFDWSTPQEVLLKVDEEHQELTEALKTTDKKAIAHEIGDMMFSLAQLARHLELEPEAILRETNRRFERRFEGMIEICKEQGLEFSTLSDEQKNSFWEQVKASE